jgi:hypothetical protein
MKRGSIIGVNELDDALLQRGKRLEAFLGQLLLESLPDAFDRIDLGRGGWLEQQDHILGNPERLSSRTPRVIEQEHVECVRTGPRKLVEKALDVVLIQLG